MTWLSRVELNPARRTSRGVLGSPQSMHAAIMAAFPGQLSARSSQRVLWRLDPAPGVVRLYVVAPEEPDFTHLVEQAGWPTLSTTWQTRDYEPLLAKLTAGQPWAFRLTANPARSRRAAEGAETQRYGHVTVAQQQGWLASRAAAAGFDLVPATGTDGGGDPADGVVVRDRSTMRFRRGEGTVTIARATFEGRLIVKDADVFRQTLVGGIGPAKAYGCGLLTVAPV
jgi:CRISPR system Cascade subunit CasE